MSNFKKGIRASPSTEFKKGHPGMKGKENPLFKHGESGTPRYHCKMNKINYQRRLAEKAGRPIPDSREICLTPKEQLKFGLCFDHNHKTGKFRGWICRPCNIALGMIKDNIEIAENIIEYLKKCEMDDMAVQMHLVLERKPAGLRLKI